MAKIYLIFAFVWMLVPSISNAQKIAPYSNNPSSHGGTYLLQLDDAQLDIGLQTISIFALDDRATLSSNPSFQAMWNLIRLGATLESLLNGNEEPLNDVDLSKKYGRNGYNKTVIMLFLRYGFGESDDVKLQRHFVELGVSPGYFKQGNKGMNLHLDYQNNILKTNYGAGGKSISRAFDYEVFLGGRIGFDWSFGRSESEAGFFNHLMEELERVADENDFSASQLIMLEDLAKTSKVLLPEDVGGRTFHIGPLAGCRFSKKLIGHTRLFANGLGFYDLMDLASGKKNQENKRSQHQISVSLGLSMTIGAEGKSVVRFY